MTLIPRRSAAFVVRIWWERPEGEQSLWRGQAIHTDSRQVQYFDCLEDLLEFIETWTGELHGQSPSSEASPKAPRKMG
ncbi:MAG: hypothetical protein JXA37_14470 [Chloroflexia bacterium]|nr:hypothetical protein [Chloroflexia bacterium]